ncbi:hypothetical protein, partial [Rhizobium sp. SEMIA 4088]
FEILGPGLVTGASDDDPSGIATYSQAGAQFGYIASWTLLLTCHRSEVKAFLLLASHALSSGGFHSDNLLLGNKTPASAVHSHRKAR